MEEESVDLNEILARVKELEDQISKQRRLLVLQNDMLNRIKEETRTNDDDLKYPVTFSQWYEPNKVFMSGVSDNFQEVSDKLQAVSEKFDEIQKSILNIDGIIGETQEKPLRMGVLRKMVQSGEASIIHRLDFQTKQINELTNAHNDLVKNVDKLVVELQNAFAAVTNSIQGSHWSWTMGQGVSFNKRLN